MNLTGTEFEKLCMERMKGEYKRNGSWLKRRGVAGAQRIGRKDLIEDLVDFYGEANGIEFKMECKVTSNSSFELREVMFKRGQYEELKAFDGVAFLLVHWNPRTTIRKPTTAKTVAIPVYPGHPFWWGYENGIVKSLTHVDCEQYGIVVEWNVLARFGGAMRDCRKLLPDLVAVVERLSGLRKAVVA